MRVNILFIGSANESVQRIRYQQKAFGVQLAHAAAGRERSDPQPAGQGQKIESEQYKNAVGLSVYGDKENEADDYFDGGLCESDSAHLVNRMLSRLQIASIALLRLEREVFARGG